MRIDAGQVSGDIQKTEAAPPIETARAVARKGRNACGSFYGNWRGGHVAMHIICATHKLLLTLL